MKPFTEDQRKAIQDQLKQFEGDVPDEIHSDVETFVDKMCIWAGKNTEKIKRPKSL